MHNITKKTAVALGLAGVLALGGANAVQAASIPSQTVAVKNAAPNHIADVRWRGGWGWGPGIGFGIAAGALAGAAFASSGYWYGGPYAYGYPAYSYAYPAYGYAAPAYVAPYPYYRRRVVIRRPYWRAPRYAYWGGPAYW